MIDGKFEVIVERVRGPVVRLRVNFPNGETTVFKLMNEQDTIQRGLVKPVPKLLKGK